MATRRTLSRINAGYYSATYCGLPQVVVTEVRNPRPARARAHVWIVKVGNRVIVPAADECCFRVARETALTILNALETR